MDRHDDTVHADTRMPQWDALGQELLAEFRQAEFARAEIEQRWLQDLRQYKGIYEPEVEKLIGERSKAYVRTTRVKVKTVDARVADLLFPAGAERNWTIQATPRPTLDNSTRQTLLASLWAQLQRKPSGDELQAAVRQCADDAALRMTQVLEDQLSESAYPQVARKVLHSGHIFGTGILKAPLVERKTRSKFVHTPAGEWQRETISHVRPYVEHVPVWRFYPDMAAAELSDCRYVYERHLFTRPALSELARRPSFQGQLIRDFIRAHPQGMQRGISAVDAEIRNIGARGASSAADDGQYELLERWGWLDGEVLQQAGVDVPDERLHECFFANVWLLPDGQIIKLVLEPINGVTWPYYLYYVDKDDTSIFGEGIPSIMRDDQAMINAATRMLLDNGALCAGPQIEANMALLSSSERVDDVHPFKVWLRNGMSPEHPALRVLNLPNGLDTLMPLVEMFKRNSDDVTAIPRYMEGQNAVQGAAGTASGMSMLLANASIVLKDLISNYDECVTRPFLEALYLWNMQFNQDDSIKGDFDIQARGTSSLMAREIRAQQLNQFAATIGPDDAPYVKRAELLRQRAQAHDLASVIKTEEEIQQEQNSNAAQQEIAAAKQAQALQMQLQQMALQKQQAEIARIQADIERLHALATKTNVDAAYAGMQAGGVVTERAHIAPAGDAILRSAGYGKQTAAALTQPPGSPLPDRQLTVPSGATLGAHAGSHLGEHAGMQTADIEG